MHFKAKKFRFSFYISFVHVHGAVHVLSYARDCTSRTALQREETDHDDH